MPDTDRTMPNPSEPLRGLRRTPESPETFEAVDRLMALATEKRADRASGPRSTSSALALSADLSAPVESPSPAPAAPSAGQAAAQTAGRVFSALRPILPALTAALRMVDHGAVQAAARLLPLLAGIGTPPNAGEVQNSHALLEAGLVEQRKELDELRLELVTAEEQLTQLRWKGAQLDSEQTLQTQRIEELSSRVRLLGIAVILLVPLVGALVALLFMHLRN